MLDICINGCSQGLWEGVLAGTSVQGPKSQEGTCESLKSPIALAIAVNVSDDQQPEFRSLSECCIVIFLNKLKIVENT
jgi:hypothetical protein